VVRLYNIDHFLCLKYAQLYIYICPIISQLSIILYNSMQQGFVSSLINISAALTNHAVFLLLVKIYVLRNQFVFIYDVTRLIYKTTV